MGQGETTGFVMTKSDFGLVFNLTRDLPRATGNEFTWWVNNPGFPPRLKPGYIRDPKSPKIETGYYGFLVFPINDTGKNGRFYRRLSQWSTLRPTAEQLERRKLRPVKGVGEIDLLQLAFELADCASEHRTAKERFLDFATVYGPLGSSQIVRSEEYLTQPTQEMEEDLGAWFHSAWSLAEVFKDWLAVSDHGPEVNADYRIRDEASRHLTAITLAPLSASRRGGQTFRPIPTSLDKALWLTVWSEYSQSTEIGRCKVCGSWFSARGHQKSGASPKKTCGNTCNQRARYYRRKQLNWS